MIRSVLFDLDGTLIHSAPGILSCFTRVLADAGVKPVDAIDQRVIGPPLMSTLKRLTGMTDGPELERIATNFRALYDAEGAFNAEPYEGLVEVLTALGTAGRTSIMVTNKRIVPTRIIADRLRIAPLMAGLYSLDAFTPPLPKKVAVVERVLRDHTLDPATSVLVGDSVEDAEAAAHNGVGFIAVTYGYGSPFAFTERTPVATLDRLTDLPDILARLD